ncbi:MAG: flagellar motor stator protein MotA [Deltaproteobacteria bacterium]|nr:flagellar motor stator protein MotA [Deltaproteobacteria bacterium]
MLVMVGIVVVLGAVLGGFAEAGGPFPVLIQIGEFMIIGGAALGTLIISAPPNLLKKIINRVIGLLKGNKINKTVYLELLKLLYELFQVIRKDGLIALESHIERPKESQIFQKYPKFLNNHHLMNFLTDTLRLIIMGGVSPHEIEMLMDQDIELHHTEGAKPGIILSKIGDAMPGLGIVAAVLGIIITMQAIGGPAEQVGKKVAAALVGTFLGVFMCYGFLQPIATNIELTNEDETRLFEVIKNGIICTAKGFNPIVAIEFARRSISSDFRPSFEEMEAYVKGQQGGQKSEG